MVNVQLPDLCPSRQGIYLRWNNHTADYVMANKIKFLWNLTGKVLEVVNTVLINMLFPSSTLKRDEAHFSETSVSTYMVHNLRTKNSEC
jgi:hypothetical protein